MVAATVIVTSSLIACFSCCLARQRNVASRVLRIAEWQMYCACASSIMLSFALMMTWFEGPVLAASEEMSSVQL